MQIHFFSDQACTRPDLAGLYWRGVQWCEVGTDSAVVNSAWVRWRAQWGGSTFKIVAWDEARPIGEADPRKDYWQLPSQARSFTAEGKRDNAGTMITCGLLQQAK